MINKNLQIVKPNDIEDKDFINISSNTGSNIGRKLAYTSTFNLTDSLIGKITSLRTAMDYIVTPNYPFKLLTKNKLKPIDIKKIPTKRISVSNYWSIVTHLVYVRIKNDNNLLEMIKELKDDVYFTSFNVKKYSASGIDSKIINYNNNIATYVNIVGDIIGIIKNNKPDTWDKLAIELMSDNKLKADKGVFDGVPFNITIDETIFDKESNND